jgi:hypothetical protein
VTRAQVLTLFQEARNAEHDPAAAEDEVYARVRAYLDSIKP